MICYDLEQLSQLEVKPKVMLKSGCYVIDKMTHGLKKGGIHLIAGASGHRKSFTLLHMALLMSQDNDVVYFSLENDLEEDKSRIEQACKLYKLPLNNKRFNYVKLSYEDDVESIYRVLNCNKDFVVFIDGTEFCVGGDTGAGMFASGKQFMENLMRIAEDNDHTFILSWQLCRGVDKIKIEDISFDHLSTSMSAVRIAYTIWAVKTDYTSFITDMILLKSRGMVYSERKAYSLCNKDRDFCIKATDANLDILNKIKDKKY